MRALGQLVMLELGSCAAIPPIVYLLEQVVLLVAHHQIIVAVTRFLLSLLQLVLQ